jgi:hypothetical protein
VADEAAQLLQVERPAPPESSRAGNVAPLRHLLHGASRKPEDFHRSLNRRPFWIGHNATPNKNPIF